MNLLVPSYIVQRMTVTQFLWKSGFQKYDENGFAPGDFWTHPCVAFLHEPTRVLNSCYLGSEANRIARRSHINRQHASFLCSGRVCTCDVFFALHLLSHDDSHAACDQNTHTIWVSLGFKKAQILKVSEISGMRDRLNAQASGAGALAIAGKTTKFIR